MKDAAKYSMFNARGEELETKKGYMGAWTAARRCIIPANSFFEWKKLDPSGKNKQPYCIALGNCGPLSIAGLWQDCTNKETGEKVTCCSIVTTTPNMICAQVHDRMPFIVGDENLSAWLGEDGIAVNEAAKLAGPFDASRMALWPVSRDVGNVRNTGIELLDPLTTLSWAGRRWLCATKWRRCRETMF